jgi:hypothetical protein
LVEHEVEADERKEGGYIPRRENREGFATGDIVEGAVGMWVGLFEAEADLDEVPNVSS